MPASARHFRLRLEHVTGPSRFPAVTAPVQPESGRRSWEVRPAPTRPAPFSRRPRSRRRGLPADGRWARREGPRMRAWESEALVRLPGPWALTALVALAVLGGPVLPEPNISTVHEPKTLCRPKLIETGKNHYMSENVAIEDSLYYAYTKPKIIKHPCNQRMALYLGKQVFLSTDNFHRSLIPLNIPKSFKVGDPVVTSAVYSSSNLLLAINGNIYSYEFSDNFWRCLLEAKDNLTKVQAEYCCYGNDFSCLTVSYLVLAYTSGQTIKNSVIYISNTMGINFKRLNLPELENVPGTLEAIFYFHSISKFSVLLKQGNLGKFAFLDSERTLTWGVDFYVSGHLRIIDLPGLKGFLILWNERHLFFSHNNGQLTEEIPVKVDNKIIEENFNQSGNNIFTLAAYENELALITAKNEFYYGTLGLLSTSLIKITDASFVTEDSAIMFRSVGNVIIVTPKKPNIFKAFDFLVCEVNIQLVLMNLEIGLKTCKAEVLRGDFNKKLLVLDMGKQLNLTAKLVPQPAQSPIPIITVSNPYALGFKAKMSEDGYTHDGNTKFTINITVMQQHVSGKAAKSFVSDIKISSLSTIMLDLVDRGMSCIDLQPPVGLISIGCNWKKRIHIRRELTACKRGFLKAQDLQRNYVYTLEKGSYDPDFQSKVRRDLKELRLSYDYESLGCPVLVYYNSPWKPVIELWEGSVFQEVVGSEFVMIEVNGLFTYSYSLTVEKASCKSQAQNWSSMIETYPREGVNSWNRRTYISCHEKNETIPLLWPEAEYQVLGGSTNNHIIFDQRNGIYIFTVCIVDPLYSYCDLTTTFSVFVYGAFPKRTLPEYLVVLFVLLFMFFPLWLGHMIPKMLKTKTGKKVKVYFQKLLPKKEKEEEEVKFRFPKLPRK